MKQVTIENVQARIAQLETSEQIGGRLPIRHEFEMACLQMLANLMRGVEDDVRSVVALLENNEWAEHCTKTELGQRLESEITRLVGHVQPVPVASDADPSLNAMMRALDAFYADDDVPERAMLAAFRILLADLRNQAHQEPAADNTAQQFEALATSGKSEHLLNAERIAREAKALSDRLNDTGAVHTRVSGWSKRQQKVISYSLWRFMHSAYEMAADAAQKGTKEDFDRFMQEAKDAEEIREEFTSAGSGKP